MIAYLTRLALAALTWPSRRCEHLTAQALADAQQCPDLVEPPEPEPDAQEVVEPEPIYQEIVSEIVLDAAAVRLWDQWDADSEAWEDERIAALVERRRS